MKRFKINIFLYRLLRHPEMLPLFAKKYYAEAFLKKVVVIGDGNHTYCKACRSSEEIRVDKSD